MSADGAPKRLAEEEHADALPTKKKKSMLWLG